MSRSERKASKCSGLSVNLGETVAVEWIDSGGRVLVVNLGNEAGGVPCRLNGTRGD